MPNVDFTLDDIRGIVRDEIVAERVNTREMIHEEIVAERVNTREMIHEEIVAERVNTREMIHEEIVAERLNTQGLLVAERLNTGQMIQAAVAEVRGDIHNLRKMLEEDARAEGRRIDRIDKRSLNTQKLLDLHVADKGAHR